jgi:hypothetical protein
MMKLDAHEPAKGSALDIPSTFALGWGRHVGIRAKRLGVVRARRTVCS